MRSIVLGVALTTGCSLFVPEHTPSDPGCSRPGALVALDALAAFASGTAAAVAGFYSSMSRNDHVCEEHHERYGGTGQCTSISRSDELLAVGLLFGAASAGYTYAAIRGAEMNAACDAFDAGADPFSPPSSSR